MCCKNAKFKKYYFERLTVRQQPNDLSFVYTSRLYRLQIYGFCRDDWYRLTLQSRHKSIISSKPPATFLNECWIYNENWIFTNVFLWLAIPCLFFFIFVFSNVQLVDKISLISGFERRISGVRSDHSTNWATTTAPSVFFDLSFRTIGC